MINKTIISRFYLLSILLLTGCATSSQTDQTLSDSITITNTATLVTTPIQTPTVTPLPTRSIPTPTDQELEALFNVLYDESCQLPCYLGITPGQSTYNYGNQILENMGATLYVSREYLFQDESMDKYYYSLDANTSDGSILHRIEVYTYKGLIFRIDVSVGGQILYKYWAKYSIPSIFDEHGVPDKVYVASDLRSGNDVSVTYNAKGFDISNGGIFRNDELVCPGIRENITNSLVLILFDPNQKEVLSASGDFDYISVFSFQGNPFQVETNSLLIIETGLGLTPTQFYEQMMADPSTCFERKGTMP